MWRSVRFKTIIGLGTAFIISIIFARVFWRSKKPYKIMRTMDLVSIKFNHHHLGSNLIIAIRANGRCQRFLGGTFKMFITTILVFTLTWIMQNEQHFQIHVTNVFKKCHIRYSKKIW